MTTTKIFNALVGSRPGQRGYYDLLSIGIGATIAIAFATVGLWQKREEMLSQQMAAQGDVLKDIGNSINGKYLAIYYSNLVNGTPVSGVANEYAPTMAELEAINVVPAGYSTTSAYGTPYVVALAKTPAGCVAPSCDIAGMVYIDGAITDPSTGRPLTLDDAAAAIGGDGGYSDIVTASSIAGLDGNWSLQNPLGNVAGVLAMRVGYGSSGWSAYVRRDGSLPMEGDLNFKGTTGTRHNIANAATVNANTYVTTNGAQSSTIGNDGLGNTNTYQSGAWQFLNSTGTAWAPVNTGNVNSTGSVTATGNVTANGSVNTSGNVNLNTNGAAVSGAGQLEVNAGGTLYLNPWSGATTVVGGGSGSGNLEVAGHLQVDRAIDSNNYIKPGNIASVGAGCGPWGAIGSDGSQTLFCQSGVWKAVGSLAQDNCGWMALPGGGNGGYGTYTAACPVGWYVAGYGNYREGDWKSTGEAQILCCSVS